MGGPQIVPVLAELAQSRAKQPRALRKRAAEFKGCDDPDREINQRETANRKNPAVLPEQRHQKKHQKRKSEGETEDEQKSEDKGLLDPLALFFEFSDEEIEAGVESRDKSIENSLERLKEF